MSGNTEKRKYQVNYRVKTTQQTSQRAISKYLRKKCFEITEKTNRIEIKEKVQLTAKLRVTHRV